MYNYIIAHHKGGTPKALKKSLPAFKVIVPGRGEQAIYKKNALIINWGVSEMKQVPPKLNGNNIHFLNYPGSVITAVDKRKTLVRLWNDGVPAVEWTEDFVRARAWLKEGRSVFGRKLLQASQGDGIVLAVARDYKASGELPKGFEHCKIWTKNFPKEVEARIHVFGSEVIDYQEKRQVNKNRFKEDPTFDKSLAKPDHWVRNFDHGWVFCHDNVQQHRGAMDAAVKAVKFLGLDFGAVDVLISGSKAVVCEVNTAPGLEGQTMQAYVKKFTELLQAIKRHSK